MKNIYYLCWVDDVGGFIPSYSGHIELLEQDYHVEFIIDEHQNTNNFDSIARVIDDKLIFIIDYNLKGNDGIGVDGDELILKIREYNQTCIIVFYSSKATQVELRKLVKGIPNIICILRESLQDILLEIAKGEIGNRIEKLK